MDYTAFALKDKIIEIYPEVREQNISVILDFNAQTNTYHVTFKRGSIALSMQLGKKDVDDFMNNAKCAYLGVHVTKFIKSDDDWDSFARLIA